MHVHDSHVITVEIPNNLYVLPKMMTMIIDYLSLNIHVINERRVSNFFILVRFNG